MRFLTSFSLIFCIVCHALFYIFALIIDYSDKNLLEKANNDIIDAFNHDKHNYHDKSL